MKIELWGYNRDGVIFPEKTGIIWSNQCGGTSCAHPEMEGIFVPLNTSIEDYGEHDPFLDAWGSSYVEYLRDIPKIEALWGFLVRVSEEEFLQLIEKHSDITGRDFYECGEAWIPVKVIKIKDSYGNSTQFESFIDRVGILTYPNSD